MWLAPYNASFLQWSVYRPFKVMHARSMILIPICYGKRVCDLLLVLHSNFGLILHRFWGTATYWLRIANFSYYLSFGAPASHVPLEIPGEFYHEELKVVGLSSSEDCMIAWVIWTQCQRLTEGWTDVHPRPCRPIQRTTVHRSASKLQRGVKSMPFIALSVYRPT